MKTKFGPDFNCNSKRILVYIANFVNNSKKVVIRCLIKKVKNGNKRSSNFIFINLSFFRNCRYGKCENIKNGMDFICHCDLVKQNFIIKVPFMFWLRTWLVCSVPYCKAKCVWQIPGAYKLGLEWPPGAYKFFLKTLMLADKFPAYYFIFLDLYYCGIKINIWKI